MCFLWGIPYLLIKVAVEDVSPPVLVLARTGVGALILLPIAASRGYLKPLLPLWRWVVAFAVLEIAGPWLLLSDAERKLSSSFTGILIASVPIVAALVSRAIGDGDSLDRTRVLGLAIGIGGVITLLGLDLGGQVGAALEIFLVVIGYGTAPLIVNHKLADVPSMGVISSSLAMTAIVYVPFAALNWPDHVPSGRVFASLAGLAVACTVVAFLVFFALIAESGANRALVITFVNPAVAVTLGVIFLNEPLTSGLLIGFPLILMGCVLATRKSAELAPVPAVAEP
jgi:drug/metabolite transporter (DMT)-like permease